MIRSYVRSPPIQVVGGFEAGAVAACGGIKGHCAQTCSFQKQVVRALLRWFVWNFPRSLLLGRHVCSEVDSEAKHTLALLLGYFPTLLVGISQVLVFVIPV